MAITGNNVILDGHYDKFVQKAKRNAKMLRVPTLEELERNGFGITDLYFLVLPNGLQVNPETVDPGTDLFDDAIKPLFLMQSKACGICAKEKPVAAFRKRPGRGGIRSVCMECEETVKADMADNLQSALSKDQIRIVDGKTGMTKRYVAYEDVVTLVNEAFRRGKSEGIANTVTVRPSLDELLGARA